RHRLTGHREPLCALAWSPDGKRLVSGGVWGELLLWDAAAGRLIRTQTGHTTPLKSASWSCHGAVASVGEDGTVRVWNAVSGRTRAVIRPLPGGRSVTIGATGHYRGWPGVERDLVYIVRTEKGQKTLTPEEFGHRHGWKNDPERVGLAKD